jgi:CrcB protein
MQDAGAAPSLLATRCERGTISQRVLPGHDWQRTARTAERRRVAESSPSLPPTAPPVILPADAALLVALGAVPGAWLRFRMVNHLEPMLPRRHWGTLTVNGIACFVLGLLMNLERSCGTGSQRLLLLLVTGFLGSFSTFSSFMAEVHAALRQGLRRESALLVGGSLLVGLSTMAMGLAVGAG